MLPGGQTAFDLDDVRAGLSYTVRVSARVGAREGGASVLTVRRGEHGRRLMRDSRPTRLVLVLTPVFDPQSQNPRSPSQGCGSWHQT